MVALETGELGAAQRSVPADQQQGHVADPSNGGGVDRQQDLEESLGSEGVGLILVGAQSSADRLESDSDPGVSGGVLIIEVAGGDGDQLVDRGEAAGDRGIGGAAVLEGAEVGGDHFGCPPLGAGVGHPGGEVGQIGAIRPPGVRCHRIFEISDQVVAERRPATPEAGFRSVISSLQIGGSHPLIYLAILRAYRELSMHLGGLGGHQ